MLVLRPSYTIATYLVTIVHRIVLLTFRQTQIQAVVVIKPRMVGRLMAGVMPLLPLEAGYVRSVIRVLATEEDLLFLQRGCS